MVSHPFTQTLRQRYINNIYLAITYKVRRYDVPFKLSNPATATKPARRTLQKTNNTKSFTGKVGLRQDATKTSDSCPSKTDGEMLLTRFGI